MTRLQIGFDRLMLIFIKRILLLATLCITSACVTGPMQQKIEYEATFNHALFDQTRVIEVGEVTRLNDQQKREFFEFYNDPKFALTEKHLRVATYLGLLLDQFTYSEKTYTAQQVIDAKGGNCLSLTMLTTAFARLVDVDIKYQLLEQNPTYSIDNNVLVTSDHLRAVLTVAKTQSGRLNTVSRIRIDYFDTDGYSYIDNISVPTQLSMFYSNIAAEQLVASNYDSAYAHAHQALKLDPNNASALNTIGLAHHKKGDEVGAERVFKFGLRSLSDDAIFVNNYANLLRRQKRDEELSVLLKSAGQRRKHPWKWVQEGEAEYEHGNYRHALQHYQRAISLAPDLHQLYFLAGRASYAAGNKIASQNFLNKALALANDMGSKKAYKRKLSAFKPTQYD